MKDFIASEKFLIGSNGQVGGIAPSAVNDIIKWNGSEWVAGTNPGGSGGGEGSSVPDPFTTNLISGQSIQSISFNQTLGSDPSIATDLEIDGDGSIIPYTISGINTTGYTAIFAQEIPNNNYKIHTVFGGGGGGGSSSSHWQTGVSDLYYNDKDVSIQRNLTIGGNLTVNGTQTIVNTETVEIEDHNLVIGANTHYTGFTNPYPGAGDAYAGILWGTGDAGAASSVSLTYQSNKGFAFEGGYVGIGTTTPDRLLDVDNSDGDAFVSIVGKNDSRAAILFGDVDSDNQGRIDYDNSDDHLHFSTAQTEAMRIDSDGNVGIGTTDPQATLHCEDPTNISTLRLSTGNSLGYSQLKGGGTTGSLTIEADQTNSVAGSVISLKVDGSERMRIDSVGNVGIGTTNPVKPLETHFNSGALYSSGVSGNSLRLRNMKEDTANSHCGIDLFAGVSTVSGNNPLARIHAVAENAVDGKCALTFQTRSTGTISEAMRIDSDGNVGIGTTSPDTLLHLSGENTAILRLENSDTSLSPNQIIGGVEFEKLDASGAGAGVVGGVRMYTEGPIGESTYLALSTSSSTTNDSEAMRITSAGNVGIGTTDPRAKFDIRTRGDTFDDGLIVKSLTGGARSVRMWVDGTTDKAHIGAGTGTEDLILNHAGGKVGIGTTSPEETLHVSSSAGPLVAILEHTDGESSELAFKDSAQQNNIRIGTVASGFRVFTSDEERMRIDSSGNVGIGTTNPSARLNIVDAHGNGSTSASGQLKLSNISTDGGTWGIHTTAQNWNAGGGGKLGFFADDNANQARMIITQAGNVGIGTTNPSAKLEIIDSSNHLNLKVADTISQSVIKFSDSAGLGAAINYDHNTDKLHLITNETGSPSSAALSIDSAGNVGIGTTSPGSYKLYVNGTARVSSGDVTSDDRVKHNEQPIVGALETLSKITPKKYIKTTKMYDANHDFELDAEGNPVDENGETVEYHIEAGVIAQQVLTVDELAFAVSPEGVDENGAVTSPHGLDYNSLFTYAIAAIQEQQQLIDDLKSRIETLEQQ